MNNKAGMTLLVLFFSVPVNAASVAVSGNHVTITDSLVNFSQGQTETWVQGNAVTNHFSSTGGFPVSGIANASITLAFYNADISYAFQDEVCDGSPYGDSGCYLADYDYARIQVDADNGVYSMGSYLDEPPGSGSTAKLVLTTTHALTDEQAFELLSDGTINWAITTTGGRDFGPSSPNPQFAEEYIDITIAYDTAAVPVPGAAWLFGSALLSIFGVTIFRGQHLP